MDNSVVKQFLLETFYLQSRLNQQSSMALGIIEAANGCMGCQKIDAEQKGDNVEEDEEDFSIYHRKTSRCNGMSLQDKRCPFPSSLFMNWILSHKENLSMGKYKIFKDSQSKY